MEKRKRPYEPPEIRRIKIVVEESVLKTCKAGYEPIPNNCRDVGGQGTPCKKQGS